MSSRIPNVTAKFFFLEAFCLPQITGRGVLTLPQFETLNAFSIKIQLHLKVNKYNNKIFRVKGAQRIRISDSSFPHENYGSDVVREHSDGALLLRN